MKAEIVPSDSILEVSFSLTGSEINELVSWLYCKKICGDLLPEYNPDTKLALKVLGVVLGDLNGI